MSHVWKPKHGTERCLGVLAPHRERACYTGRVGEVDQWSVTYTIMLENAPLHMKPAGDIGMTFNATTSEKSSQLLSRAVKPPNAHTGFLAAQHIFAVNGGIKRRCTSFVGVITRLTSKEQQLILFEIGQLRGVFNKLTVGSDGKRCYSSNVSRSNRLLGRTCDAVSHVSL